MKQIFEDLWQTKTEHPFSGVNTHAYFLKAKNSHVLIYNTGNCDDINKLAELGGVDYQLLSHRHESGSSLEKIKMKYKSILCASQIEHGYIGADVDIYLEEGMHLVDELQVIFTPGHTSGGICFYYNPPNRDSYLFTGDTYYISNHSLQTLVFAGEGGNSHDMKHSLLKLRELRPDFIISSASVGTSAVITMTEDKWKHSIDNSILNLK